MSVDIAYIVSHGFAARMVTQTNLLKLLRDRGKTVALICPDKNDTNLRTYCRENDIRLVEFNAKKAFGDENYMFKRKYFLEDIESNPALLEKHVNATRYNTSKHPVRWLRPYYYWLFYKAIPFFPAIRKSFIEHEKNSLRSKDAESLIEELRPKKLVATYPVNYNEAVLLHYGNRHQNVETWIHLLSWDNITCKGRWPEIADRFIAWGPTMKEELEIHYGINEERIYQCGVPHFDLHHQIKERSNVSQYVAGLGLDPTVPYVFFGMSSPRFAPGEIDIVEWLAKQIDNGVFESMQLIVRPHPQNVSGNLADHKWLPRLRELDSLRRVAVDFPRLVQSKINWSTDVHDMVRLSNFISGSMLVINSGSTISIDALTHGKPVVLTSFDGQRNFSYWRSARRLLDYPHLTKLHRSGGVDVVRSFDELVGRIKAYRKSPDLNLDRRTYAVNRQVINDGLATSRVANVLLS